jgi:hypothetical protein
MKFIKLLPTKGTPVLSKTNTITIRNQHVRTVRLTQPSKFPTPKTPYSIYRITTGKLTPRITKEAKNISFGAIIKDVSMVKATKANEAGSSIQKLLQPAKNYKNTKHFSGRTKRKLRRVMIKGKVSTQYYTYKEEKKEET